MIAAARREAPMTTYGQFCPVAKAMELLDERWTMLVVRELLLGSRHFNELRRGLPRMSPALLSKRLRRLARAGVIERHHDQGRVSDAVTDAGRELLPVVEALGRWGTRWIPQLGDADLDPQLLLWDMHRNLEHGAMPDGRTVLRFEFTGVPAGAARWWLVATPDGADVCDDDPGQPVTVTLTGPLRLVVRLWRGDVSWSAALQSGLGVDGPEWARRDLPRWLRLSMFAPTPRPEKALV
jgi:DNA-binding HxlR family transcriptional regulator